MGAESPAIIGSILSIIVIVLYGKLTASKEEKARKSHLKTKDILNAWSIYLLILFLIILTSPLFPGLRHTLENNWITRISLPINASTVNYTISWLTHAGVLLFIGTFIGGLIQGAKVKDLFIVLWNTVKQLKKTFITVICLVGLSTIMDSAGMIAVIATALATATGSLYRCLLRSSVVWERLSPEATPLPISFSESCKQVLQGKFMSARIGCLPQIQ